MSKTLYKSDITITTIEPVHIVVSTRSYMLAEAKKWHTSPLVIDKVITCESNWQNVQSVLFNKKRNHREESYGIAQINLPAHPEISKTQALDERFSIRYIVSEISKGNGRQWSCYRKLFP